MVEKQKYLRKQNIVAEGAALGDVIENTLNTIFQLYERVELKKK